MSFKSFFQDLFTVGPGAEPCVGGATAAGTAIGALFGGVGAPLGGIIGGLIGAVGCD